MSFFSNLFNKENSGLTEEQKEKKKQIDARIKHLKSIKHLNYKNEDLSGVEIENSYFGNGILIKTSGSEKPYYIDVVSGFDKNSFGKKNATYDIYEFLVDEDNLDYVLASLEKIYRNDDQIMEAYYDEIYNDFIEFFKDYSEESLKKEFSLEYLKAKWYVRGVAIYDDHVEIFIGVDAMEDPEAIIDFDIIITVEYSTLEPSLSFDSVC